MNPAGRASIDRDALLARVDLESLLDSLTTRAPNRRAWHCIDPNHPDEHPSVTITVGRDRTQRWRCWSGGHGGTAIDAVVVAKHLDVGAAMRWLNDHHAHLEPLQRTPAPEPRQIDHPHPEVIRYIDRAEKLLWAPAGRPIREWLFTRGLREPVLRANRVGADPGRQFLPRPRGLPAGWPAAVFPVHTQYGAVSYFQARVIDPRPDRSKYDNPASRWASNPRAAWLKPVVPRSRAPLVVTEGIPDALIAAQAGFHSVGILGALLADERTLVRLVDSVRQLQLDQIAICFDADPAGRAAEDRLTGLLRERGMPTLAIPPPDGTDLTTWAAQSDRWIESLQPLIEQAQGVQKVCDLIPPTQ